MRIAVVPASPLIANGLNIPADIPGTLGTSIFDMDISDTQSTNTTTNLVRTDGSAEQPLVEDMISTSATSQDATDLRQPQPDSLNTTHAEETNISPTPNETSSSQEQEVGLNDVILIPDGTNTTTETNFPVIPESNEVQNVRSSILPEHYNWFNSVHNCWMGHRGVKATLDLLHSRNFVWKNMKNDVKEMVLRCPTCQKLNVRKLDYQTHPFTTSSYQPHERINVDSLVLNKPDQHGNIAIIVVIDTFTRWIELYPIPKFTEEIAALKLL